MGGVVSSAEKAPHQEVQEEEPSLLPSTTTAADNDRDDEPSKTSNSVSTSILPGDTHTTPSIKTTTVITTSDPALYSSAVTACVITPDMSVEDRAAAQMKNQQQEEESSKSVHDDKEDAETSQAPTDHDTPAEPSLPEHKDDHSKDNSSSEIDPATATAASGEALTNQTTKDDSSVGGTTKNPTFQEAAEPSLTLQSQTPHSSEAQNSSPDNSNKMDTSSSDLKKMGDASASKGNSSLRSDTLLAERSSSKTNSNDALVTIPPSASTSTSQTTSEKKSPAPPPSNQEEEEEEEEESSASKTSPPPQLDKATPSTSHDQDPTTAPASLSLTEAAAGAPRTPPAVSNDTSTPTKVPVSTTEASMADQTKVLPDSSTPMEQEGVEALSEEEKKSSSSASSAPASSHQQSSSSSQQDAAASTEDESNKPAPMETSDSPREPEKQDEDMDVDNEVSDHDEFVERFKTLLDGIERQGAFSVSKQVQMPPFRPKIVVSQERIAFPLANAQANMIRQVAEQAPYGKGMDTVVDTSVRKAWQLDASKVEIGGSGWETTLQNITNDCVKDLGLTNASVKSNLYKLLLYEQGGHFKPHCDTEKEPGMFGTLVIQLPSKFTGGALHVRHGGVEKVYDWSKDSEESFCVTAFYADCMHELRPVTSGWRLCLIYNLVVDRTSSTVPSLSNLSATVDELRMLEKYWSSTADFLTKGYLLEHKYTDTNLTFANLKGRDKEIVKVLRGARGADGKPLFVVSLVKLQKHESGTGESSSGGYGRRYHYGYDDYDDEPSDYEMDEVYETTVDCNGFIGPNGKDCSEGSIPFEVEDLLLEDGIDPEDIFGEDPDDKDSEGYTGNAGPTVEYWYYQTAVVFWPVARNDEVVKRTGAPFLISYLSTLDPPDALGQARNLVTKLDVSHKSVSSDLLGLLQKLGDVSLIAQAIRKITPSSFQSLSASLRSILSTKMSEEDQKAVDLSVVEALKRCVASSGGQSYSSSSSAYVRRSLHFVKSIVGTISDARKTLFRRAICEGAISTLELSPHYSVTIELLEMLGDLDDDRLMARAFALIKPKHLSSLSSGFVYLLKIAKDSKAAEERTRKLLELCFSSGETSLAESAVSFVGTKIGDLSSDQASSLKKIVSQLGFSNPQLLFKLSDASFATFVSVASLTADAKALADFVIEQKPPIAKANQILKVLIDARKVEDEQTLRIYRYHKAQILEVTKQEPQFSWCQRDAKFSGSQADSVNAFLRGPQPTATFRGFTGIAQARTFARQFYRASSYRAGSGGWYASATANGTGRNSYVLVSKEKKHFGPAMQNYQRWLTEKMRLERIFYKEESAPVDLTDDPASLSSKRPADDSSSGNAAKKSRPGDRDQPIELD